MAAEPFIDARAAAAHAGYAVNATTASTAKPMKAFYAFCHRHPEIRRYTAKNGRRVLFLASEIDAAMGRTPAEQQQPTSMSRLRLIEQLAQQDARGEGRRRSA